ncbi:MAG: hypothetical protein JWM77_3967 [Rhodospirillales bacterium]|nr:hypothetical protein [Rhodospirillales bacterium]
MRVRFAAIALLIALSSCASAPPPLPGDRVHALLVGNTANLPDGFQEHYAPDGTLYGRVGVDHYTGRWEQRGNAFCTSLSGDAPVCTRVFDDKGTLSWAPDSGAAVPLTITPGRAAGV